MDGEHRQKSGGDGSQPVVQNAGSIRQHQHHAHDQRPQRRGRKAAHAAIEQEHGGDDGELYPSVQAQPPAYPGEHAVDDADVQPRYGEDVGDAAVTEVLQHAFVDEVAVSREHRVGDGGVPLFHICKQQGADALVDGAEQPRAHIFKHLEIVGGNEGAVADVFDDGRGVHPAVGI